MEEIVIVEPDFFSQFKCVGSDCIEHCCKGWEIELDKPTVTRYMESENIEIRNIAVDKILTTQASYASWGKIQLQSNENCSFLDKDRLCKVHKSLGEPALSTTCALYPRIYASYKYEIRSNLTLSCPEAARLLLTSPDAMLYSEKVKQSPHALDSPDIFQEDRLLNKMCSRIMKSCGGNVEEGFYGIIILLHYRDAISGDDNFNESFLNISENIQNALKNGGLRRDIEQLVPDYKLQSDLLLRLQKYLGTKEEGRGGRILRTYTHKLNLLHNDKSSSVDGLIKSLQRLTKTWHENAKPWLRERHYLLDNYMQYRIYEDAFSIKKGSSLFSNIFHLMSEWFLLKWLITASFEIDGALNECDIVNIVYSYHSVTRHDKNAESDFLSVVDEIRFNNLISLLDIFI